MAKHLNDTHAVEAPADGHHATTAVPAESDHGHHKPNPVSPDIQMVVWTWVVFGVVAAILYKVAWKPILSALESRETRIRTSLEDAERAKAELAQIEERRRTVLAETDTKARETIAKAEETATLAANELEQKARSKVEALFAEAERDIEGLKTKALQDLQREQANMIISLAGRLVGETMDSDRNRSLTDRLIKEL